MKFDISNSINRFYQHLQPEENDRIIFSGKFGAGKTYFLREFFEEMDEEYVSIHLFPINYSVASNEDIFELIKFDILFNLLEKGAPIEDNDNIPHEIFLYFYMQNNATDLLTPLLGLIPKIGSHLQKGAERAIKMVEEYNKEKKEADKSESDRIKEYLESIRDEKGKIYEEDLITRIIINFVESLRSEGKKVVLIVDDLDRIDPGHLFRILNVLSAHTDRYEEGDNKFGFDKIILTFDLKNVKNIYHHQYGNQTDFNGYLDKFYTSIFPYHLTEGLMNRIGDIVTSINHTRDHRSISFNIANTSHVINAVYLISCLIHSKKLTVRNVLMLDSRTYNVPLYSISFNFSKEVVSNYLIFIIVDLLLELYKDMNTLEESFRKIKFLNMKNINIEVLDDLILSCIPLLNIERNNLEYGKGNIHSLELNDINIIMKYEIPSRQKPGLGVRAKVHSVNMDGKKFEEIPYLPDEIIPELYKRIIPETIKLINEKNLLANRPN